VDPLSREIVRLVDTGGRALVQAKLNQHSDLLKLSALNLEKKIKNRER
jgi:hypothetical protein